MATATREAQLRIALRAVDQAGDDPDRVRADAQGLLAVPNVDGEVGSIAERALGLVARKQGDLAAADRHLRRAASRAERGGLAVRAAEARMSRALVLAYQGRSATALRELDRAAKGSEGLTLARVLTQRALILQRLGKGDEALALYRQALPVVSSHKDDVWEARLRNNRAVLLAYRGQWRASEADLRIAERLDREAGRVMTALGDRQNLGWLAGLRGDVPDALTAYDATEVGLREAGLHLGQLLLDRAELQLGIRLVAEARSNAERAAAEYKSGGMAISHAEALVVVARAALADGDPAAAVDAASQAAAAFKRQDRQNWSTLAQYELLRAQYTSGDTSGSLMRRAAILADKLEAAGWWVAALDARIVAARVALELRRDDEADDHLRRAAVARRRGPAELRARAWHAEALRRLAAGNQSGADRALRAGVDVVARHRSSLGATDLRTHATGLAEDLTAAGLELALASGRPNRVLAWTERGRAGTLHLRPVRPPDDSELAADLATLRRATADLHEAGLAGSETAGLLRRQAELEASVRRRARHASSAAAPDETYLPGLVELQAALGERALAVFCAQRGDLHAVTLTEGRSRLARLGTREPVEQELAALRFAMRRLAARRGPPQSLAAARQSAQHAAQRLDAMLLVPLQAAVGDRPLVIVPTGALHALPWAMLPTCHGRTVTVTPSAAMWLRATRATTGPVDRRMLLAAGLEPPHAAREVSELAHAYPAAKQLTGSEATAAAVLSELDRVDLAHLACHGNFRADNPLFSSLLMADGPLNVYDLEGLEHPPQTVVLSACDSGLSSVRSGDELMGLAAALLALGTRTLIASVVPVPDDTTRTLMRDFHRLLREGRSPAGALTGAQEHDDEDVIGRAGFVCFGAG